VPGLSFLKLSHDCPWRPRLRSLRRGSSGVGQDLDLLDLGDVDHGAVPPFDPAPNAELLTGKRLGVDARRLRRVVPSVSVRVSPSLTSATVPFCNSEKSQAKAEAESGVKRRAGSKKRDVGDATWKAPRRSCGVVACLWIAASRHATPHLLAQGSCGS
jgi:hypothetical protein